MLTTLYLSPASNCYGFDVVVHHGRVDGVHHREIRLHRVGLHFMLAELHWSAARHPLSMCRHGCACCVVGRDRKVEETKVIMAAGIKGKPDDLEYRHALMAVLIRSV